MRMCLVRMVHGDDELRAVEQSHQGHERDAMLEGIRAQHEAIQQSNPAWALELLRQVLAAEDDGAATVNTTVGPGELRHLAHRLGPWWI